MLYNVLHLLYMYFQFVFTTEWQCQTELNSELKTNLSIAKIRTFLNAVTITNWLHLHYTTLGTLANMRFIRRATFFVVHKRCIFIIVWISYV